MSYSPLRRANIAANLTANFAFQSKVCSLQEIGLILFSAIAMQSLSRFGDQVLSKAQIAIAMQSLLQWLLERFAAMFAHLSGL